MAAILHSGEESVMPHNIQTRQARQGRHAVTIAAVTLMGLLSLGRAQAIEGHWTGGCSLTVTHKALCRSFLRRVSTVHCITKACAAYALRTDPRFRNPPWKVLNPYHREALIARLFRYRSGLYRLKPAPSFAAAPPAGAAFHRRWGQDVAVAHTTGSHPFALRCRKAAATGHPQGPNLY